MQLKAETQTSRFTGGLVLAGEYTFIEINDKA